MVWDFGANIWPGDLAGVAAKLTFSTIRRSLGKVTFDHRN